MLKIAFTIIILTFCLVSASFTVKTTNYCKITQQTCKGKYDHKYKFRESCEKEKCSGQFGNQCTEDYCAFQDENCSIFYWHLFKQGPTQRFIDKIKNCPVDFKFKPVNVCLNQNNCKTVDYDARHVLEIKCLCPSSHSFECSNHLCTVDKRTCEAASSLKIPIEFNKCLNGNRIYKKGSFLSYIFHKIF